MIESYSRKDGLGCLGDRALQPTCLLQQDDVAVSSGWHDSGQSITVRLPTGQICSIITILSPLSPRTLHQQGSVAKSRKRIGFMFVACRRNRYNPLPGWFKKQPDRRLRILTTTWQSSTRSESSSNLIPATLASNAKNITRSQYKLGLSAIS